MLSIIRSLDNPNRLREMPITYGCSASLLVRSPPLPTSSWLVVIRHTAAGADAPLVVGVFTEFEYQIDESGQLDRQLIAHAECGANFRAIDY